MVIAVLGGLAVGLLLGLLGGGGSILAIPILVYGLHQDPHVATTDSLVIVGISSLVAMIPYLRRGEVLIRRGLVFGALGIAGSWLGATLARGGDAQILLVAFGVLLLVVAALMIQRARHPLAELDGEVTDSSTDLPDAADASVPHEATPVVATPKVLPLVLTATIVGTLTGFFGVGGGFAIVPALVIVLGVPMGMAAGTSLLIIALNSATTFAIRATHGITLDWPLVSAFTIATVIASLVGAALSDRVPATRLQLAFATLLVVVAGVTLAQAVPAAL